MDESTVYFWEYQLHARASLNSASIRRAFPGALLRVGAGFGCLHPWPEFGDEPLEAHLESLRAGRPTPLARRALDCAEIDGLARVEGRSLFEGLEIPANHYSWSFGLETEPQMRRVLEEGWPAIKAKGFPNWGETMRFLEAAQRRASGTDLRFRVDFNSCLDAHAFQKFIEFMPLRVWRALDFVEDPFSYESGSWQALREKWGVRLALDKGWQRAAGGFDLVVVKPARRDWRAVAALHPASPLMITSAMDHPLGQMFAAWEAAVALAELGPERVGLGGLCTQHLFFEDAFTTRVLSPGGRMQPDTSGGGLGFGDLLEKLPWRPLI
jgi:O-succinylbenzoate synthase